MQNYGKVVAGRFLVRIVCRKYRCLSINVNFLKRVYMEVKLSVVNLMLDITHTNE